MSISDVGQASVAILSLFGGFPKKIAPPDRLAWLWTGLASLIAATGFFITKLLSSHSWTSERLTILLRIDYMLFALLVALFFAYILTLGSKTAEFAQTRMIVGTKLTTVAKNYKDKNPNVTRVQLLEAFGGEPETIWTPTSIRTARFVLAVEYSLFIALLALAFNLGIELLSHPATNPVAKPIPAEENSQLQDVHFDFNENKLSEDAREKLSADAILLNSIFKTFPKATLTIEGHCDDQGGIDRNLALGYQRAEVVKKQLTDDGILASKISIASYGKGSPLCIGSDEPCRQKNRRVHLRVVP